MTELAPLAYIAIMAGLVTFLIIRADQQNRYYRERDSATDKEIRRELLALIPGERRSAHEYIAATETRAEASLIRANKPQRERKPTEDVPLVLDGRNIPAAPPWMFPEPDWKHQSKTPPDGLPGDTTGLS